MSWTIDLLRKLGRSEEALESPEDRGERDEPIEDTEDLLRASPRPAPPEASGLSISRDREHPAEAIASVLGSSTEPAPGASFSIIREAAHARRRGSRSLVLSCVC